MQQDDDPMHTSKSTSGWLKNKITKVLGWSSQSQDRIPNEDDQIHGKVPKKLNEMMQYCKDEWAKVPPHGCERLIKSYWKPLLQVISGKGRSTTY